MNFYSSIYILRFSARYYLPLILLVTLTLLLKQPFGISSRLTSLSLYTISLINIIYFLSFSHLFKEKNEFYNKRTFTKILLHASLLFVTYMIFYVFLSFPSFMLQDTFRDLIFARNTLLSGRYIENHLVYPLGPFTTYLYSTIALINGEFNPYVILVLLKIICCLLIIILSTSISRFFGLKGTFTPLFIIANSQLLLYYVLTSIINETLALIFMSTFLCLALKNNRNSFVLILLGIVLTLTHLATAIIVVIMMTTLYLKSAISNGRENVSKHTKDIIIILTMTIVLYLMYTSVNLAIKDYMIVTIDDLFSIFLGEPVNIITRDISPQDFVSMHLSTATMLSIAIAGFLNDKSSRTISDRDLLFFFGAALVFLWALFVIGSPKSYWRYFVIPGTYLLSICCSIYIEQSNFLTRTFVLAILIPLMTLSTLIWTSPIPIILQPKNPYSPNTGIPSNLRETTVMNTLTNIPIEELSSIVIDGCLGRTLVLNYALANESKLDYILENRISTKNGVMVFDFVLPSGFESGDEILNQILRGEFIVVRPNVMEYLTLRKVTSVEIIQLCMRKNILLTDGISIFVIN